MVVEQAGGQDCGGWLWWMRVEQAGSDRGLDNKDSERVAGSECGKANER